MCHITILSSLVANIFSIYNESIFTALNELLRPGTSLRPNGFQVGQPVKVPKTQTLVKNLFDLQQAINNQVPNQDVQNVGNTLFQGQEQLQAIMGNQLLSQVSLFCSMYR